MKAMIVMAFAAATILIDNAISIAWHTASLVLLQLVFCVSVSLALTLRLCVSNITQATRKLFRTARHAFSSIAGVATFTVLYRALVRTQRTHSLAIYFLGLRIDVAPAAPGVQRLINLRLHAARHSPVRLFVFVTKHVRVRHSVRTDAIVLRLAERKRRARATKRLQSRLLL